MAGDVPTSSADLVIAQLQQQLTRQLASQQQAEDPRSAYLTQALQEIGQTQSQGNAMGLGANLLADALDQYGLNQRRQQLAAQGAPLPTVSTEGMAPLLDPSQLQTNFPIVKGP